MMKSDISEAKGVGPNIVDKLTVLGIKTKEDLIWNFPRKYEDYSEITPVNKLRPGQVTIKANIKQVTGRYVRRGMHITEAVASDDTDSVRLVWFNQPYREKGIKTGHEYFISGNYELGRGRFAIMNPGAELTSHFQVNTARIIPIYRETKGFKSAAIRKIISEQIDDIKVVEEGLPKSVIQSQDLLSRGEALMGIHFPTSIEDISNAKKRLAFEEVFTLVLSALINKQENMRAKALKIPFKEELAKQFVARLPYKLTDAQRKVTWQVYKDIGKDVPANRLIEGDVGSGKTVVAAMASLMALAQNFQVALMAPTEILARQHADNLVEMLKAVGMDDKLVLLLGSMKPAQKKKAHEAIKSGKAGFIVGTHALISEKVDMKNLGLVIIDEQHRFGVEQQNIAKKAGHVPHLFR